MKYEIEIEDVSPIVIQDLMWLYNNGVDMNAKDLNALKRVIKMYLTQREFEDWEATGVYA